MYVTICEIDHQSRLEHEIGCSGPVHWDNPEGWDGEGGGEEEVYMDTYTPMADSCECMAKTMTIF